MVTYYNLRPCDVYYNLRSFNAYFYNLRPFNAYLFKPSALWCSIQCWIIRYWKTVFIRRRRRRRFSSELSRDLIHLTVPGNAFTTFFIFLIVITKTTKSTKHLSFPHFSIQHHVPRSFDLYTEHRIFLSKKSFPRAVVVAQLVKRSLSIPEVRGSSPVIGKHLYWTFTVNCINKTKIKKKRPGLPRILGELYLF